MFENVCCQIEQISVIFTHSKLWVAVARHNFEWVKNVFVTHLYITSLMLEN